MLVRQHSHYLLNGIPVTNTDDVSGSPRGLLHSSRYNLLCEKGEYGSFRKGTQIRRENLEMASLGCCGMSCLGVIAQRVAEVPL